MIQDEIMKLQTYKMFEGDSDIYVMRDDVLEVLKQYIDLTDIVRTLKRPSIPKQPAIDVIDVDMLREIKLHDTGKWIDKKCSVCGWHINPWIEEYSFCPNCGAEMKGGTENE